MSDFAFYLTLGAYSVVTVVFYVRLAWLGWHVKEYKGMPLKKVLAANRATLYLYAVKAVLFFVVLYGFGINLTEVL